MTKTGEISGQSAMSSCAFPIRVGKSCIHTCSINPLPFDAMMLFVGVFSNPNYLVFWLVMKTVMTTLFI